MSNWKGQLSRQSDSDVFGNFRKTERSCDETMTKLYDKDISYVVNTMSGRISKLASQFQPPVFIIQHVIRHDPRGFNAHIYWP